MMKMLKIRSRELLPYFAIFMVICVLIYVQVVTHATIIGADSYFHWLRFYDIKEQIITGKFSWFQTNFTFKQTGRIINALYGPLFAYLNAILLFIVRTWYQYEVITNILLNFIAASGLYKLTQKVNTPKPISVILSIIYINIGMIPSWIEGMNFSAWGSAFIPYLLIQIVNLLEDKEKPIHVVPLVTCISLIANIHLLSTLLIIWLLMPVVIISFFKTKNKKVFILNLLKVVIGVSLLTANVWGGLLIVYSKNAIATPSSYNLFEYAIHLSHFQSFRQFVLPSMVVLFGGQFIYAVLHCKKQVNNFIVTIFGFILFIISSRWVLDWSWIQTHFPFVSNMLQFPFRLTTIAYPLLLLGLAYTFAFKSNDERKKYKEWNIGTVFSILVMFQVVFSTYKILLDSSAGRDGENSISVFTQQRYDSDYIRKWTKSQTIVFDSYDNNQPDYLPISRKGIQSGETLRMYNTLLLCRKQYQHIVNKDGSLTLRWKAKKQKKVTLPLVMYKQSRLIVNGKELNKVNKNDIGAPIIVQKKGENTANLRFIVPLWFNILLVINILGWIGLIVYYLRKYLVTRK
ncbi:cell division protein [Lactobacillus mulieris]|uniref:cell division protein n=2 Tax=Lactobacillus mulieris TaxID=2508708 RepID=UPI001F3DC073|nr:cell division protein [Lactobacillus mulieris]MCF1784145.1 cell division protein [Lactobacillus mulieris]